MRHFSYFLFENYDVDVHSHNPLNPRRFLNRETDAALSYISEFPAGSCNFETCLEFFGSDMLNTLIACGVIRKEADCVLFDTPVFLREDASVLRSKMNTVALTLTDELEKCVPQIRSLCDEIKNGFPVELNLYHILCGNVFDGVFFDYLEQNNAVATSRAHTSGLDYLSIIYEQCEELDTYSDGLLCSYNRFANSCCALQSFGDANGNRHDFYRFFRLMEIGNLSAKFQTAQLLLGKCGSINKDEILLQVTNLIRCGSCSPSVLALLEHFGYAKEGMICVPVYTPDNQEIITKIAKTVEEHLGNIFIAELTALSKQVNITANKHGVSPGEIANELYHILFGSINGELVRRKIVAQPPYTSEEGRYLRSIQLY